MCHLLQEAETTGKMHFLSTLKRLRQDRMKMIETVDQYKFLHRAALVGHMAAGTSIPVQEISERIKRLESHQNNGFRQEFDALSAVCVEDTSESTQTRDDKEDDYEEIQTVINKQKNRLKNAYMPELRCEVKTMDKYINAVLVPSLTKTRHNILTQLPLPSTVTDFWRLVTQYNVGLVVAFQADSRHTDEVHN
ncbi:receptor-type tyrosine-protein phosphatase kappa [Plakobranchus ocellatus]|uniref:Receptor-type tyrosine-protein phosphatase kappa n=1 Tax=Plakobranchus ocellatus TaxID=259542 RepID=A0AAV4A7E2_9GAST|nr:receptor-type tyrosine-protein phosphatase kappa [Plakobranchus ocellatus]